MAEATEELEDTIEGNGNGSRLPGKDVLLPAAATAAAAGVAALAAQKGPDLMKKLSGQANGEVEKLGKEGVEKLGDKGLDAAKQGLSSKGLRGKALAKLIPGGGGSNGQGGGKTRRLPIQRWTDVAVPVDKAYQAWIKFEEYPKFMHRVLEVKQEETNKIHFSEKIWFSSRQWDAEITERRRNDRIAWKSVSGTQHSGIVSFHKLDTNLTRVLVTVDFVPSGMIEKMASGMRFVKRAIQADLARFKAYVEFGDARGLEYKSTPEEMEQHRDGGDDDGEDGDEQGDRAEAENRGENDDRDDEERESDREERANRREERRKAAASS